ncbi:hypothetical protein GQ53DRAFT_838529 [Thozetella sp. PMI_491]|nr:hypothetical protein GQ53DRAFT_838529 [Thozetella sp. PMI_491]
MPPSIDTGVRSRRRPHRKSKSGCLQCKKKKIKCNEQKPSCGYCTRVQSRCSFLGTSSTTSSTFGDGSTASQQPPTMGDDLPRALDLLGNPPAASGIGLEVGNLELLHFYTTTTSFTLSIRPELQKIWQQVVPQIAFSHAFLLHGILAFSALHLARSQPARKGILYKEASSHHDIGLAMFRTAMMNLTPYNYDACLAFSTIIAAYTWASSDQTGDLFFSDTPSSHGESSVDWASLLRGVYSLLGTAGEWMASSSMQKIVHPRPIDPKIAKAADPEVSVKLTALRQLWDPSPGNFNAAELEALEETLNLLHADCGLVTSSCEEDEIDIVSFVYAWPIKVPGAFLLMVKQLKPEALIVLAHYSLLLNRADQVWYMRGMSRRLLKSIHSKIGDEWESWIAWPLQKLVLTEFKLYGDGVDALST